MFALPLQLMASMLWCSRINCRQHFFAVTVVRIWNSLPEDIVSADRLSLFVRLLNRVNLSEFLIGKS